MKRSSFLSIWAEIHYNLEHKHELSPYLKNDNFQNIIITIEINFKIGFDLYLEI